MTSPLTIGVIGAGQMGSGIAQVCAASGFKTLLWDQEGSYLDRGISLIHQNLQRSLDKGKITESVALTTRENLERARNLDALQVSDIVIEAIVEKFEPKAALFKKLDEICPGSTILASNTSSISITKLAGATKRAHNVIGLHFMNPVPVMKLVEIIRGLQTSQETYDRSTAFVTALNKTLVTAIDSPGFIVNRVLVPMINEAIFLLQEGVTAEDIDAAMKLGTNQPMGPLELADFVGLDTLLYILQVLHKELGDDKYRPCPLLLRYVDAGWYGKKVGRGFYCY